MTAMSSLKPTEVNKEFKESTNSNTITLRQIKLSDANDLMVWASDNRVCQYTRWDAFTSRDEALDFIKNYAIPHPWFRLFCIDSRPIGSVCAIPNPSNGADGRRAELSLVMAFEYWSKGIATNVVKMATSMIFEEWSHLERLEAFVYLENEGAQRVLEKAGFTKEGVLRKFRTYKGKSRDLAVFSLLSSDYTHFTKIRDGGFRINSCL